MRIDDTNIRKHIKILFLRVKWFLNNSEISRNTEINLKKGIKKWWDLVRDLLPQSYWYTSEWCNFKNWDIVPKEKLDKLLYKLDVKLIVIGVFNIKEVNIIYTCVYFENKEKIKNTFFMFRCIDVENRLFLDTSDAETLYNYKTYIWELNQKEWILNSVKTGRHINCIWMK